LDSGLLEFRSVDIALTVVAPERTVRKAKGDLMFGYSVMLGHVTLNVARTSKRLTFEANPILVSIFAFMTLKFRKMFRVFV
jgi:hypothetical protein